MTRITGGPNAGSAARPLGLVEQRCQAVSDGRQPAAVADAGERRVGNPRRSTAPECASPAPTTVGDKFRRRQLQVAVVGDTVETSVGEDLVRSPPVRHDRTRGTTHSPTPAADPHASTPPDAHHGVAHLPAPTCRTGTGSRPSSVSDDVSKLTASRTRGPRTTRTSRDVRRGRAARRRCGMPRCRQISARAGAPFRERRRRAERRAPDRRRGVPFWRARSLDQTVRPGAGRRSSEIMSAVG
jgi:hypothetical protein